MSNKLTIHRLPNTSILVIKKIGESNTFFTTTTDSIIISKEGVITLVNFMLKNGFLDERVVRGLLEEYHTL